MDLSFEEKVSSLLEKHQRELDGTVSKFSSAVARLLREKKSLERALRPLVRKSRPAKQDPQGGCVEATGRALELIQTQGRIKRLLPRQ